MFYTLQVTFAEPERIELQTDSISQIQRELCSNDYKISRLESEDSDLENPTQPENISGYILAKKDTYPLRNFVLVPTSTSTKLSKFSKIVFKTNFRDSAEAYDE